MIFKPESNVASIIVAVVGMGNVEIDEVLAITRTLWVVEVRGFQVDSDERPFKDGRVADDWTCDEEKLVLAADDVDTESR